MSRRAIFTLVNLALLSLSGYFIYYLGNAAYREPVEIERTIQEVDAMEAPAETSPVDPERADLPHLTDARLMRPLLKITPTPTPSPSPTPRRFTLKEFISSWEIVAMTPRVTMRDTRDNSEWSMVLNGAARMARLTNQSMQVALCDVNLEELSVTFCSGGQRETKQFILP